MAERSRWWEFEQFVREILRHTPGVEILDDSEAALFSAAPFCMERPDEPEGLFPAQGFDIEALRDDRALLVEIKTQTPQITARLDDLISQRPRVCRAACRTLLI
jgi:hypothetical protein